MKREDKDLAWMLQFENIAWYEDGRVDILDRRIYPAKKEFVRCRTHLEVAQALDAALRRRLRGMDGRAAALPAPGGGQRPPRARHSNGSLQYRNKNKYS